MMKFYKNKMKLILYYRNIKRNIHNILANLNLIITIKNKKIFRMNHYYKK